MGLDNEGLGDLVKQERTHTVQALRANNLHGATLDVGRMAGLVRKKSKERQMVLSMGRCSESPFAYMR